MKKTYGPELIGPDLAQCGQRYDLAPDYHIEFAPGPDLLIEAGALVATAAARFSHPRILATRPRVYEFRTYYAAGAKRWHARAGISHYLLMPKTEIRLVLEKGHSYVPVVINGVFAHFNVSGGTVDGWTDFVGQRVSISVGHSVRDLRGIADAARLPTEADHEILPDLLDKSAALRFLRLAAAAIVPGRLRKLRERGGRARVQLAAGCRWEDKTVLEIESFRSRGRTLCCREGRWSVRVKYGQVDWIATARLNGIEFVDPAWGIAADTGEEKAA